MRLFWTGLCTGLLTMLLTNVNLNAAELSQKGQRKKAEAETVEMKDVPAAVTDAAKKEVPNANFTAAQKTSQKKRGTLFTLEGKDGKYAVTVTYTSTGDLQRLVKSVEAKRKKAK